MFLQSMGHYQFLFLSKNVAAELDVQFFMVHVDHSYNNKLKCRIQKSAYKTLEKSFIIWLYLTRFLFTFYFMRTFSFFLSVDLTALSRLIRTLTYLRFPYEGNIKRKKIGIAQLTHQSKQIYKIRTNLRLKIVDLWRTHLNVSG